MWSLTFIIHIHYWNWYVISITMSIKLKRMYLMQLFQYLNCHQCFIIPFILRPFSLDFVLTKIYELEFKFISLEWDIPILWSFSQNKINNIFLADERRDDFVKSTIGSWYLYYYLARSTKYWKIIPWSRAGLIQWFIRNWKLQHQFSL